MALLPQVIGYIQTATGCGTLRRANGIAVQVMVGDPVCQGDVIETAADGRIGIRFIDGTVFSLSPDTRVELNEFVCDSSGTSHSALLAVTRGTFAFAMGGWQRPVISRSTRLLEAFGAARYAAESARYRSLH